MSASFATDYKALSLRARLGVALVCAERFCAMVGLHHPELDTFFDDMWRFPTSDFPEWDRQNSQLIKAGLGDEFAPVITTLLADARISESTFRALIESTVEIIFYCAYGATDDNETLQYLDRVLRIASSVGVPFPPGELFSNSLFAERGGWGFPVTEGARDKWRFAPRDEKLA